MQRYLAWKSRWKVIIYSNPIAFRRSWEKKWSEIIIYEMITSWVSPIETCNVNYRDFALLENFKKKSHETQSQNNWNRSLKKVFETLNIESTFFRLGIICWKNNCFQSGKNNCFKKIRSFSESNYQLTKFFHFLKQFEKVINESAKVFGSFWTIQSRKTK